IYRVVHESTRRDKRPQMLGAPSSELVAHLSHANGWWRDTAQKLLVVRADRSVVPLLQSLARSGDDARGRMHALWTLDGLGQSDPALLEEALADPDPRVRAAAIRIFEPFLTSGGDEATQRVATMIDDPEVNVVIQLVLSLGHSGAEGSEPLIKEIASKHEENPNVQSIIGLYRSRIAEAQRRRLQDRFLSMGETNYQTICLACHGADGRGTPAPGTDMTLGAPLVKSPRVVGRKDIPIKIMLKGMVGELDGKQFPGPMLPLETFDDEWIASVLTYVRQSWGNHADLVTPEEVAAVRAGVSDRTEMWSTEEILAMAPLPIAEMRKWKLSASHNPQSCGSAIDGNAGSRWDTGTTQAPGMWFSFDMREPRELTAITLHTENSPHDYPREYQVEISQDGESWTELVSQRSGSGVVTDIVLPATQTRHVRISQHGRSNSKYWSIHQLEVFAR
ncbi:MAG: discoidin domain-containing protein, partial [Verrucomicrobiales bacterium]